MKPVFKEQTRSDYLTKLSLADKSQKTLNKIVTENIDIKNALYTQASTNFAPIIKSMATINENTTKAAAYDIGLVGTSFDLSKKINELFETYVNRLQELSDTNNVIVLQEIEKLAKDRNTLLENYEAFHKDSITLLSSLERKIGLTNRKVDDLIDKLHDEASLNEKIEDLKKQQEELSAKASDPAQKQAALNLAKDYEIQSNALKGQVAELEKIRSAKVQGVEATKQDTKALKEQLVEQQKIAKAKEDLDLSNKAKKEQLVRQDSQKSQEKGIETNRDKALDDLKIKQEQEIAKFRQNQEDILGEKKRGFEKEIADFKDQREKAVEDRKRLFEKGQQAQAEQFQQAQQAAEESFRKSQQAADDAYQKKKQANEKAFNDSLSGAKGLIDREAKIGTAKPEDAAKFAAQFAEEDRIRQQVLSTNVDTKASKQDFANQAKSIAGVGQIKSQEDAAKVQFALAELEAKAKAQFAEEERAKDKEYQASKQESEKAFKQGLQDSEKAFKLLQDEQKLVFERTVIDPQKKATEAEIEARKLAFEQTVIQPLKLEQETALAVFKQGKDAEAQGLKLKFENDLEALRKTFKLQEIDLDTKAQKERLDRESAFKENQRNLDFANAQKIAQTLSLAQLAQSKALAAVGVGQNKPQPSSGVKIDNLTIQSPDPVKDITGVLQNVSSLYGAG